MILLQMLIKKKLKDAAKKQWEKNNKYVRIGMFKIYCFLK